MCDRLRSPACVLKYHCTPTAQWRHVHHSASCMGLGRLHYSMCIITHRPVVIPTCSCRMCMVIGGPVDQSSGHWEAMVAAVI